MIIKFNTFLGNLGFFERHFFSFIFIFTNESLTKLKLLFLVVILIIILFCHFRRTIICPRNDQKILVFLNFPWEEICVEFIMLEKIVVILQGRKL